MVSSQDRPPPTSPPLASYLWKNFSLLSLPLVPKDKSNQRSEKMQKQSKTVKQDKIIGLPWWSSG